MYCLAQAPAPLDTLEMLAEADPQFENHIVYMNPAAQATLEFYHRQINPLLRGAAPSHINSTPTRTRFRYLSPDDRRSRHGAQNPP